MIFLAVRLFLFPVGLAELSQMSFSTECDKALDGMASSQKSAVKSAFTTVQTALTAEQTTYGSPQQEKISLDEKLLALARDVRSQMM